MSFYKSGFRRVLNNNRSNAAKVRSLDIEDKTADTARDNLSGVVSGHTSQISTHTGQITTLNTFKNDEDQVIHTEEITATLNDFMFRRPINSSAFGNTIPTDKMVQIIYFAAWLYNPDNVGNTPRYNAAVQGHLIVLTRNSATLSLSGTNVNNASQGNTVLRIGQTGGTTWLSGLSGTAALGPQVFANNMDTDGRRSTDHLNQFPGGLASSMDSRLAVIAMPQASIAADLSALGAGTKIKLRVKYRLLDFPTLS